MHFAHIDSNSIVTQVIVAEQDFIDSGAVGPASEWIRTSYNATIRHKYAGIGDTYNKDLDVFTSPCPGEGYTLNTTTFEWSNGDPPN